MLEANDIGVITISTARPARRRPLRRQPDHWQLRPGRRADERDAPGRHGGRATVREVAPATATSPDHHDRGKHDRQRRELDGRAIRSAAAWATAGAASRTRHLGAARGRRRPRGTSPPRATRRIRGSTNPELTEYAPSETAVTARPVSGTRCTTRPASSGRPVKVRAASSERGWARATPTAAARSVTSTANAAIAQIACTTNRAIERLGAHDRGRHVPAGRPPRHMDRARPAATASTAASKARRRRGRHRARDGGGGDAAQEARRPDTPPGEPDVAVETGAQRVEGVEQLVGAPVLGRHGLDDRRQPSVVATGAQLEHLIEVRRASAAPGRSALFTTKMSAISMSPALAVCIESPQPGVTTTTSRRPSPRRRARPARRPRSRSARARSPRHEECERVRHRDGRARPWCPLVASDRMKTRSSSAWSCIRTRSPRSRRR